MKSPAVTQILRSPEEQAAGYRICDGVELDTEGREVAYYVDVVVKRWQGHGYRPRRVQEL